MENLDGSRPKIPISLLIFIVTCVFVGVMVFFMKIKPFIASLVLELCTEVCLLYGSYSLSNDSRPESLKRKAVCVMFKLLGYCYKCTWQDIHTTLGTKKAN